MIIRTGLETAFDVGAALLEIRDEKLYHPEFDTFEAFCASEFKIVRARAYQLINASKVKSALPPEVSEQIENEGQARALAAVPEENRAEVVAEAAKAGPLTAERIAEAAAQVVSAEPPTEAEPEKPKQELDKTGYPIPSAILEDWKRAEAFKANLQEISRIKGELSKGLDDKDPIFIRELNSSAVSMLQNLYAELKGIIPYAVCTSCQGKQKTKCSLCKGSGFISQFAYNQFVPAETKALRERMAQK